MQRLSILLALAALFPACTVESRPTAGVRSDARGRAVIIAPRCAGARVDAVQVADLDGAVRWRVEGGGNEHQSLFVVGRLPPLMQEVDPLDGPLDPDDAYVATVQYTGSLPDVEVEFRLSGLSPDRVIDADGDYRTQQGFIEEADLTCVGGWLWVAGGIGIAVIVAFVAAIVVGLWVVVRVMRTAKRQREQEATPSRPDLIDR